jgi:hypothetical protein
MVRYFLIALCSGFADQVFWWRLAARGFGLVDDTDPAAWRERPSYRALAHLLAAAGEGTFERRVAEPETGAIRFHLRRPDGEEVCLAYARSGSPAWTPPFRWSRAESGRGEPLDAPVTLGPLPVYFRGVSD